jgi:dienelactone hydrolase
VALRILLLLVATLTAQAADSNSLALPVNLEGTPVASKANWARQRVGVRTEWLKVLGELPARKPPLKTEFLEAEQLNGFERRLVKYQVEPGEFVDGYLLTPANSKGKLPAVVVFHPTTASHAKAVAGVDPEYPEEKRMGVQLVQRGYVVWCPRNYINTDGADWKGNATRLLAAHPQWTGMTRMVWDAIRAADFVVSLPNVDRKRVGCLGHSLGGKQVLYAMAFDERYRAGVSSEGGIGLSFSNWEAPWYLGTKIRQPGFALDHQQLLALTAPRAFLLLAGDSADGERSRAYIEAARPVYALLGAPGNIALFDHHLGHRYPPEARVAAETFLDEHLKK